MGLEWEVAGEAIDDLDDLGQFTDYIYNIRQFKFNMQSQSINKIRVL
jgi:hypothetical protein